jgi:hypothetical protein
MEQDSQLLLSFRQACCQMPSITSWRPYNKHTFTQDSLGLRLSSVSDWLRDILGAQMFEVSANDIKKANIPPFVSLGG